MKKKKSFDWKKGFAVLLLCFLSVGLILGIISIITSYNDGPEEDQTQNHEIAQVGNQKKPDETENTSNMNVGLVEYTHYRLDELDFQFVIAKVRIKADEPIHISLEHFKTSEGIVLNQVDEYVNDLESNALFLGKQNVWFEIISQEKSVISNIFIPIDDKEAEEISVMNDFNNDVLVFKLNSPTGTKELLSYQPDDVITDGKTYQMKVSSAFEITGDTITRTYSDGYSEEYISPSTAQIHAFKVDAVSLWGDQLVIESAVYTVKETNETFKAFNEQFGTMKYQNLINKMITDTDSGVLFFETLNPGENPITYQGVLKLKIKGQENEIIINVDL